MERIYKSIVEHHFERQKQMAFLCGPRQVGKTTISKELVRENPGSLYLNWDIISDRETILAGSRHIAKRLNLEMMSIESPYIIFDEIHKHPEWKNLLKGFYDEFNGRLKIVVTGSAQLDAMRKGGDSLVGRYFPYRVHPFSVAECLRTEFTKKAIQPCEKITAKKYSDLEAFGGFPEPFTKTDKAFLNQWTTQRIQQLLREDVRDLTRIHELSRLELLMTFLGQQASELVNYSQMSRYVGVSIETIRNWLDLLKEFYYCFTVPPYHKNVARSLVKQQKLFLWDWSRITDKGSRNENFIAGHLLKAVHYWTDTGLGTFDLYFLRDKEKREVDFLVTKEGEPWFLVEVKSKNNGSVSSSLHYYHRLLKTAHAFQVVIDMDYIDKDCFLYREPVIVPAKTLLSQLI